MNKNENNAKVVAVMENGYVKLSLSVGGFDNVSIKVNDFGGTQKAKARKLAYAIYKKLGE